MSWVEKIQTDFIITCGDGKEFKPNWLNAVKSKEYNISEFDFPNLSGTLVSRGRPRGRKYTLEIYFQGENHLDQSEAFETSADDPRPWTMTHPFYGQIIVQPTGLSFDNTKYNVSKITGTIIETITEDSPKTSIDPKDKILGDKETLDETFAVSFGNDVKPETAEINKLSSNNTTLYSEGLKSIKTSIEAEEYFNLFNKANSAVLNATAEPLEAIRTLQAVITYPSLLQDSVKNRLTTLVNQFNLLRISVSNIINRSDKKIYENNAGTIISSLAFTSATPQDGDYGNRNDVLSVVETVINTYDTYLSDLDSLQTDNGGGPDSYVPDSKSLAGLNSLVNYTISNLFNVALNSKQERSIFVEDDTNVIVLAHRFYGLLVDDSTIDELIRNNSIGLNELLSIRKGREIVYYV